ncbi:hypothetical protein [Sphingomonas yabuuchiae]|uniref:DUF7940 domain-containing protein n=1 Tax=Sphingomonas yabuuchiae TaxID=172044 RepID=UPI003D9770CE
MRLIPDWRQSWRWWSVRVSAFGAMIFAFLLAAPDQALAIWQALPADVQALIPNAKEIGLFLTIAVVVVRVVQQRAKAAPADSEALGRIAATEAELAQTRFLINGTGHLVGVKLPQSGTAVAKGGSNVGGGDEAAR